MSISSCCWKIAQVTGQYKAWGIFMCNCGCTLYVCTLFRNKRFMLDEMTKQSTSKFVIFFEEENPSKSFSFSKFWSISLECFVKHNSKIVRSVKHSMCTHLNHKHSNFSLIFRQSKFNFDFKIWFGHFVWSTTIIRRKTEFKIGSKYYKKCFFTHIFFVPAVIKQNKISVFFRRSTFLLLFVLKT